jgi:hypothetical protein
LEGRHPHPCSAARAIERASPPVPDTPPRASQHAAGELGSFLYPRFRGFVGLGALGTFWLNSRVYRITARTFELTERGHLTDRYAKAIEQLGDDKLDVRLGGIYSLEQIAHDSPRDRDQATIVEVLSAFARVHSNPLCQYTASLPKDAPAEPAAELRRKATEYRARSAAGRRSGCCHRARPSPAPYRNPVGFHKSAGVCDLRRSVFSCGGA